MESTEPIVHIDRIAERMRILHIDSDRDLARRARVDNGTVSLLRSRKRPNIAAPTLAKIARALDCSTSYLLGETDSPLAEGLPLSAVAEEVLRVMAALPPARQEEVLLLARAVFDHVQRQKAQLAQINQRLALLAAREGPATMQRLAELVAAAVVTGDHTALHDEIARMGPAEGEENNSVEQA